MSVVSRGLHKFSKILCFSVTTEASARNDGQTTDWSGYRPITRPHLGGKFPHHNKLQLVLSFSSSLRDVCGLIRCFEGVALVLHFDS